MNAPAARTLGFSWPVLVALAALAVPRVVLHDLGVTNEGSIVNGLLVFAPPACWVAAVLWKRPARPWLTLVVVGALYGLFLATTHQLFWDSAFGGNPPALGGNLTDLDPGLQEGILRVAAGLSSVVTGTVAGVISGAVATGLCRLVPDKPAERQTSS